MKNFAFCREVRPEPAADRRFSPLRGECSGEGMESVSFPSGNEDLPLSGLDR